MACNFRVVSKVQQPRTKCFGDDDPLELRYLSVSTAKHTTLPFKEGLSLTHGGENRLAEVVCLQRCDYFGDGDRYRNVSDGGREGNGVRSRCNTFVEFYVVRNFAKVRIKISLQVGHLIEVDGVELNVVFVEGVVNFLIVLVTVSSSGLVWDWVCVWCRLAMGAYG